jgi:hypothetical protein
MRFLEMPTTVPVPYLHRTKHCIAFICVELCKFRRNSSTEIMTNIHVRLSGTIKNHVLYIFCLSKWVTLKKIPTAPANFALSKVMTNKNNKFLGLVYGCKQKMKNTRGKWVDGLSEGCLNCEM